MNRLAAFQSHSHQCPCCPPLPLPIYPIILKTEQRIGGTASTSRVGVCPDDAPRARRGPCREPPRSPTPALEHLSVLFTTTSLSRDVPAAIIIRGRTPARDRIRSSLPEALEKDPAGHCKQTASDGPFAPAPRPAIIATHHMLDCSLTSVWYSYPEEPMEVKSRGKSVLMLCMRVAWTARMDRMGGWKRRLT